MNDALDGLTSTITVQRPSAGVTYVHGRAVQAAPLPPFTIEGSFQELRPEELQVLPELDRTSEAAKIYTETELFAASVDGRTAADLVTYRGKTWKVVAVTPRDEGILDHYKVIVQRVGKG